MPLGPFDRVGAAFTAALVATIIPTTSQAAEESFTRITEEIIVTAERREENILKVPMSMTALDDTKIEELGIQNYMDLEQLVPGLQFGEPNEGTGHGTTIRGMGTARGGNKAGGGVGGRGLGQHGGAGAARRLLRGAGPSPLLGGAPRAGADAGGDDAEVEQSLRY